MFYVAQANVNAGQFAINKNQAITEEVYNKLPERLKKKFTAHTKQGEVHPKGYNELIGDSPEEKARRMKASNEAKLQEMLKEADKKVNDLEKQLADQVKCGSDLTQENSNLKKQVEDLQQNLIEAGKLVADLEKQLADAKGKKNK